MPENPYRFEFLDHTADVAVRAYGDDTRETFASAARAMFEVLADLDHVEERESRDVQISSDSLDTLLVDWLNELLFLFDAENLLLARYDIHEIRAGALSATVYGEKVDPLRHRTRTGIKAVTYHMLDVTCSDSGCQTTVVFDI